MEHADRESGDTELSISPYFVGETVGHRGEIASLTQDRGIWRLRFPAFFMAVSSATWAGQGKSQLTLLQVSLSTFSGLQRRAWICNPSSL